MGLVFISCRSSAYYKTSNVEREVRWPSKLSCVYSYANTIMHDAAKLLPIELRAYNWSLDR